MLPLTYTLYSFAEVPNLTRFYRETLPEIPKLKSIIENTKLLFKLPSTCIKLEVAEGERVYKITLFEPGVRKSVFGYLVYLPLERRLDAYSLENTMIPILQWKNKKAVFSGCPVFLEKAGIASVFNNIVNII